MNILWSPDTRSGANRGNTIRNQEEAQTFSIFDFHKLIIKLYYIFYACYKPLAYVCCELRDPKQNKCNK